MQMEMQLSTVNVLESGSCVESTRAEELSMKQPWYSQPAGRSEGIGDVVSTGPVGPLGAVADEELLDAEAVVVGLARKVVAVIEARVLVEEVLVDVGKATLLSVPELGVVVVVALSAVLDVVDDVGAGATTVLDTELFGETLAASLAATYSYIDNRLLPPQISEVSPEQVMLQDAPLSSVGAPPLLSEFPQKH